MIELFFAGFLLVLGLAYLAGKAAGWLSRTNCL